MRSSTSHKREKLFEKIIEILAIKNLRPYYSLERFCRKIICGVEDDYQFLHIAFDEFGLHFAQLSNDIGAFDYDEGWCYVKENYALHWECVGNNWGWVLKDHNKKTCYQIDGKFFISGEGNK